MRAALCLANKAQLPGCPRCRVRSWLRFSTDSDTPPPLLSKIRNDLKTAMKSKDQSRYALEVRNASRICQSTDASSRLNVLRSVIAEAGNASKTPSPIRTNMQVLSILRKKLSASKVASQEFAKANRDDLKQKQDAEIAVLDEYAGQVEIYSEERISEVIEEVVRSMEAAGAKLNAGLVLKELFRPGGALEDKPVEKAQVAAIVKRRLA